MRLDEETLIHVYVFRADQQLLAKINLSTVERGRISVEFSGGGESLIFIQFGIRSK